MKNKTLVSTLLFLLVFGLAFYVRHFTFWLPHWQGDQSQYVMMAMKLDKGKWIDFSDYNLRGINTEVIRVDTPEDTEIIFPYRVKGQRGFVLDAYEMSGLGFMDEPFFYRVPLLPVILNLSHELLAPKDQPFAVVKSNLGQSVLRTKPFFYLQTQFWAAIVPFASSMLILAMLYVWSRRAYGEATALIASFLFAVNPVGILTASRVWTEGPCLLLVMSAAFLYRWDCAAVMHGSLRPPVRWRVCRF